MTKTVQGASGHKGNSFGGGGDSGEKKKVTQQKFIKKLMWGQIKEAKMKEMLHKQICPNK